MEDRGDELVITDTRSCARSGRHVLTGLARAVYLACDIAPRQDRLAEKVARDFGLTPAPGQIEAVVATLRADRLILDLDGKFISLALTGSVPAYPDATQFPGGHVCAAIRLDAESR